MIDFTNIEYLRDGNKKQQQVYEVFQELKIFEILNNYSPLLAGTIPIEIHIESSDLDIICYTPDLLEFKNHLLINLVTLDQFKIIEKKNNERDTIICRFTYKNFKFEIFAQNRDSINSESYRHMLIEYKLLEKYGNNFRNKIINLKKSGIKTEPAFAKLLRLKGDPFYELLKLEKDLGLS